MLYIQKPENIDVVILCGGKGERLRSLVNDRPKPMAEFREQPFLTLLMRYAHRFGFEKFILATGYKGGVIKKYYRRRKLPWKIIYSTEKNLLGTGGALKKAGRLIKGRYFLVMNGDSFCRLNIKKMLDFHFRKKALLSLGLVRAGNINCGKVVLDKSQRIMSFEEKARGREKKWCSAGIYIMDKDIFSFMKKRKRFSLEYDLFPEVINTKRCFGFKQKLNLVDFGTPTGYQRAKRLFS